MELLQIDSRRVDRSSSSSPVKSPLSLSGRDFKILGRMKREIGGHGFCYNPDWE
ncbi:hypothetical protein RHMOL_Rhmol02G0186800 [Rhododendron molle]|uniref:Uncharacterized protein n=1 Tax=Rhododendron molle TaxID=49168 RepID=A0ACC0PT18_RHOML|nr:hypothetical protein RHMOL_Rhmol02G0186800 [Rhododendron molle]